MSRKHRMGVSDALYLEPVLAGLDGPESPFELIVDFPSRLALNFAERPEEFRGAFLSPIDYARHGAEYQIVPRICIASAQSTKTVRLYLNRDVRNVTRIAVDVRVTSEIILAKIILLEKYPNLSSEGGPIQFLPMMPDLQTMLRKADAALVVNRVPPMNEPEMFSLDLVEEWRDLTNLPYVHGMWIVREGHFSDDESQVLLRAKEEGTRDLKELAATLAGKYSVSAESGLEYLSSFSYGLESDQEASLKEFLRYSYYHGVLGDVPDLNFFSKETMPPSGLSPN